jgi:hypothetical protein
MFVTEKDGEFLLGLCGTDHENFVGALEGMRHLLKELTVGRRLVAAVRALAAVHALMLIVRANHAGRLVRGSEVPGGRLLMIDPNYSMVM